MNNDLETMSLEELKEETKKLRAVIRYHRDQKGWVDDLRLYEALPEGADGHDSALPTEEVFLEKL